MRVRNAEAAGAARDKPLRVPHSRTPHLIVLVRSLAQLEAALNSGVETLYCEFEDPKKYREAVALARRRQSEAERALGNLRRAAADLQAGRGMDA